MKSKLLTFTTAGLGLVAVALSASPAGADPTGPPALRAVAGVGSDTTQDVLNGLSDAVVVGGVKQIASYDATGSAQITTKASTACTNINRPNGSTAGKQALVADINNCLQFARSSSGPNPTSFPSLTSIPFALDGLTFAVTAASVVPKSLTLAEIQSIYRCEAMPDIQPVIPQGGSGTRASWVNLVTNNQPLTLTQYLAPPAGPTTTQCITVTQEHDARSIRDNQIAPFSVAKAIGMQSGLIPDLRGRTVLGSVDATSPLALNAGQASTRVVYNAVRTSQLSDPAIAPVFVGPNSLVCQATATIIAQGFAPVPSCGSTNQVG